VNTNGTVRPERSDEPPRVDGYEAIVGTAGIVERDDLQLLRMWGRDPVRMLNGLLTNDLTAASLIRAIYAAVLTPKGRVIADVRAFPVSGQDGIPELRLVTARIAAPALAEHLKKYVPPHFARWEFLEGRVAGVYGPRAAEVVTRVFGADVGESEDAVTSVNRDGRMVSAISTGIAGVPGFDVIIPGEPEGMFRAELVTAARNVGGGEASFEALETARVESGRPRYGVDFSDETLPAEVFESTGQMERAVSFGKGCYTGQEVVVRIAHRGHVNRHLRGLLIGDAAPPHSGTPLLDPETGKQVGTTTSAVASPSLGQTIALAYLRREINPGDEVVAGDRTATVTTLPFTS